MTAVPMGLLFDLGTQRHITVGHCAGETFTSDGIDVKVKVVDVALRDFALAPCRRDGQKSINLCEAFLSLFFLLLIEHRFSLNGTQTRPGHVGLLVSDDARHRRHSKDLAGAVMGQSKRDGFLKNKLFVFVQPVSFA